MLTDHTESFVWPCEFACTLVIDNLLIPNHYTITVSVEPNDNIGDVNLGFKKIKYFISNYLQNSILINEAGSLVPALKTVDSNLVLMPCEPYDYFFVSVLHQKLVTITEKYFDINYITLDSLVGDHVQYLVNYDNQLELDTGKTSWWNMDSVNTGHGDPLSWEDLNFRDTPKFVPKIVQGGLSE
jgi:hypothetical protein